MKKFIEHINKEAAPLILTFAMLPGGGVAQVKGKPEAVRPEIAAATRAEISGTDRCNSSYPPLQELKGKAKPYDGFIACGDASVNFDYIVTSLAHAADKHKGAMPASVTIEFNAGRPDAEQVKLEVKKITALANALAKRNLTSDKELILFIEPGNTTKFTVSPQIETTMISASTAIIDRVPAERTAEIFAKNVEKAKQRQEEANNPSFKRT